MLKLVNTFRINEIELYLELVQVKPQVNQSLGTYTNLLLGENDNVEELDYEYGPSSALVALTDICKIYGNDKDCEDEEGNNKSERD